MTAHPYERQAPHAFWRAAVAGLPVDDVDPVVSTPFTISSQDAVVTAGSCFAQHIARYLRRAQLNYLVTETAHPMVPADAAAEFGYGVFTARYGNIYTARQLLQLLLRAYGRFQPVEEAWETAGGRVVDPLRSNIQPGGFLSRRELDVDRRDHLAAVRKAFETLDVFAFTLGLTECWLDRRDGSAFPLCPGVSAGRFDERIHELVNFGIDEVVADLCQFVDELRRINPLSRIVLTVSPVPLVATATDQHVLAATTYSKAVLRVAAEQVVGRYANVAYFPSYEIITGLFSRGRYFADDLRSVTEAGVSHVMSVFMRHFVGASAPIASVAPIPSAPDSSLALLQEVARVNCDEVMLAQADAGSPAVVASQPAVAPVVAPVVEPLHRDDAEAAAPQDRGEEAARVVLLDNRRCSGAPVIRLLEQDYMFGRDHQIYQSNRDLTDAEDIAASSLFTGHYEYDAVRVRIPGPKRLIIFLAEPFTRLAADYLFHRKFPWDSAEASSSVFVAVAKISTGLGQFLRCETRQFVRHTDNYMVREICGAESFDHEFRPKSSMQGALDRAIANIDGAWHIGIVEHFDRSMRDLCEKLEIPAPAAPFSAEPYEPWGDAISDADVRAAERFIEYDRRLYNYALQKLKMEPR